MRHPNPRAIFFDAQRSRYRTVRSSLVQPTCPLATMTILRPHPARLPFPSVSNTVRLQCDRLRGHAPAAWVIKNGDGRGWRSVAPSLESLNWMLAMIDIPLVTAQQFLEMLQDGERWIELVRGRLIRLSPPDEVHGNVVRNVGAALGERFRKEPGLFACFELGLIVGRDLDTVRCPAISCFAIEGGLQELDLLVTERVPELVVEVASSNDRREAMSARIRAYQEWGVSAVWVFDPESRHAHVMVQGQLPRMLKENERLIGHPTVPGFGMLVDDAFADPRWAKPAP